MTELIQLGRFSENILNVTFGTSLTFHKCVLEWLETEFFLYISLFGICETQNYKIFHVIYFNFDPPQKYKLFNFFYFGFQKWQTIAHYFFCILNVLTIKARNQS